LLALVDPAVAVLGHALQQRRDLRAALVASRDVLDRVLPVVEEPPDPAGEVRGVVVIEFRDEQHLAEVDAPMPRPKIVSTEGRAIRGPAAGEE
jgi:hypothetical protein